MLKPEFEEHTSQYYDLRRQAIGSHGDDNAV